jgi:hypothetical protein
MSSDELAAFIFYRMEMPASSRRRSSRHLAPRHKWHRDVDITLGERQLRSYRSPFMALVRRCSRQPGMPDAFDRAPLR